MTDVFETKNLILRKFEVSDGEFILELLNTPGWINFIGNKDIETVEEAQLYLLTGPMSSYEKNGFGLYLVKLKNDGVSIGMCGLIKRDGLESLDLGFAFLPEYEGKGYAFEAANAIKVFAGKELKLKTLLAITQPNNDRAKKLLTRLDFEYTKNVTLPLEELSLCLYSSQLY